MRSIVAIVGRPNVGKSTFFNRIIKKRKAIVDEMPGVTRDLNYMDVEWNGKAFTLVDTGGFDPAMQREDTAQVQLQAQLAIEEADVIVFLMDGREGLLYGDIELARKLQRAEKPVFYTVNKVESIETERNALDFYRLGVEPIFTVSAKHKLGITELMNTIAESLPSATQEPGQKDEIVISIIGRPNVGKSSLINRILGYKKLLVSEVPGTTRDSIHSLITYKKKKLCLIDTAGIRRKSRVSLKVEKFSIMDALRSINQSSICMLIIDAVEGVTDQDARLAQEVYKRSRSCIIVVNKWDLVKKDERTYSQYIQDVRINLPFLDFAPIECVSALSGLRVRRLLDSICEIADSYRLTVNTASFNRVMNNVQKKFFQTGKGRKTIKLYYGTQIGTSPPTFAIFVNKKNSIPTNFKRFMVRSIRKELNLIGTPVRLKWKEKTMAKQPANFR